MTDTQLIENINRIYRRISEAAVRVGRKAEDIKLIAVTKTVGLQQIQEAVGAGLRIFGESKVQEAREKIQDAQGMMHNANIQWHLIGHLQKNKAKAAVELFDIIHSVDSLDLAETIARHAEKKGKTQKVLLQVKLSDDESKYGIIKDNFLKDAAKINRLKNLRIEGLMTIPPYFENPEDSRPYFKELREIRDSVNSSLVTRYSLQELSMGMTDDFEVAIEEGATMLRIGTAIFGKRKYCHKEAQ